MSYINRRGVDSATRRMTARQQASDLFAHGHVVTTKAFGKYTQRVAERLITLAKRGTLADRRRIAAVIIRTKNYGKDELLRKICTEISAKYKSRNGGCTRLLKTQNPERVVLSLV